MDQFQRHSIAAFGANQRVLTETVEEPLLERFCRQNSVASGVNRHICRYYFADSISHLLVSDIAVESVIADSVKPFWHNVLNHTADELQNREGLVFNLPCFVVTVPVTDGFTIISLDSANRDRRGYDIFCQVLSQPLSSGRHFSGLEKSDEAFWIVFPCTVNILFNPWVRDILPDRLQQMILPLSVHHFVWDVSDIFPFLSGINSACGHEYMKVRIILSGSSCCLEDNNISCVDLFAGVCIENIFEAGVAGLYERTQQCWVAIKPHSQEIGHSEHDMAISNSGQQSPADEVCPSVGIDFCAGKAEAGFAGKCYYPFLAAMATTVLDKAHFFGISTTKHFLDDIIIIRAVKALVGLLKLVPVIMEYLLECVFVDTFHGHSLRTKIAELGG